MWNRSYGGPFYLYADKSLSNHASHFILGNPFESQRIYISNMLPMIFKLSASIFNNQLMLSSKIGNGFRLK